MAIGPGDDAAVIRPSPGRELVVSCDQFLEGVHFLPALHSPSVAGYKCLARAVSDLAAMGALPGFFFLSLALPPQRTGKWLDAFARGLGRASREFGIELAGGDSAQDSRVAISITVLGEIERGCAVTRSGARPGDFIYVSGTLGAAQLGLEILLRGKKRMWSSAALLQPHCFPEPRLALGRWLAQKRMPTAMMDLSDGLSTDLARLCASSRVGAVLYQDRLPAAEVPPQWKRLKLDARMLALHGGEDYELLFTVPHRKRKLLPAKFAGVPLREIGRIRKGKAILLEGSDGSTRVLHPAGWDHFRRRGAHRG